MLLQQEQLILSKKHYMLQEQGMLIYSTLYILIHKAYNVYKCEIIELFNFDDWCMKQSMYLHNSSHAVGTPSFDIHVIDLRVNFTLCVAALEGMARWFLALDHTHYCQWMPVHIRNMIIFSQDFKTLYGHAVWT